MNGAQSSAAPPEPGTDTSPGPLSGLRVIELGMLLAGPFAGRLLADWGAEVIKVESPARPDSLRDWGQALDRGRSLWWPVQSRNKKCVTLDLHTERGQELLLDLASRSDALIENFRPGTLERWNIGPERLEEVNPNLIVVRVSGYGQTGPYRDRAGFASAAEAIGGLRHLNGFPGEKPPRTGISLGDSLAAMFATLGLLAALYARGGESGRGQVVDVSLIESCFALLESIVPEYDRLGIVRGPSGTGLKGIAPSNLFRSRDGRWVVIAANHDNVFTRLCGAIGRPELATDPRFTDHRARGQHQEEIEGIVEDWASERDATEIDRILNEAGVVCGPVNTVADIFADPHFQAREMLLEHQDHELGPLVGPGVVPKFSRTPGKVQWSGPWQPGCHNEEIWGELVGLSAAEIADLEGEGVL